MGNNGWMTQFPRQGDWFHFHNLMSVGIITQWIEENYRKTRIKALSISGGDMRKWRLSTKAQIKIFCVYMRNHACTDKTKIRVEYKKRHHRRP